MAQESHCCRFFIPLVVLSMLLVTGASRAAGSEAGLAPAIDCSFCDDGNACTTDFCNASSGECRHVVLVCDDANPCTLDSCDAATGCVPTPLPEGTACDDGEACTAGDACDASARCVGTAEPSGLPCDDQNTCTSADACNEAGACLGVPQLPGSPCDDGLACTTGDACAPDPAGVISCRATPTTCDDDGDLCTENRCDPATGGCVTRPVNCDDGSECTVDSCTSTTGCQHRSRAHEPCEDGNACTLNDYLICSGGRLYCAASPQRKVCDDRNSCTYDRCNPVSGCEYIPLPRDCNDGNACTTGDICGNTGTCSGAPVSCDDGNAGTIDSCDSATGLCRSVLACDGEDSGGSLMGAPTVTFKSPLGKGSGMVQWTTRCETALVGFNVVTIDGDGVRTQLSDTTIPCESCLTGGRQEYTSPIPKHKSGRNIFIEVLHISGRIETLGPAVRE